MGGRASEALRRREVDQLWADWINREDVKLFWRGGERADAAAVTGVDGLAYALTVTVIEGADEDAPSLSCVRLSELDSDVQGAYEAYLELISPFPHTDRPANDQTIRDCGQRRCLEKASRCWLCATRPAGVPSWWAA